jgi:GNAT superfamily N-acetyltransferase
MQTDIDVTVRPATVSDAKVIAAIFREVGWFPHINAESPADTEARIERHMSLCQADKSHSVLVAEKPSHTVVGYISVHWLPYLMLAGPEGYISELFVLESERGKGIGHKLLDAVRKQAVERGCARLQLVTGRERTSYEIYRKLGWKERPEIADFILPLL